MLTEPLARGSAMSRAISLEAATLNSNTVGLSGLRSQLHETSARVMRRIPISSVGGSVSYSMAFSTSEAIARTSLGCSLEFICEAIYRGHVYTGYRALISIRRGITNIRNLDSSARQSYKRRICPRQGQRGLSGPIASKPRCEIRGENS